MYSIWKNIGVNPDIFAKNIPENYVAKNNWDEDLTLKTRTRKYKQPEKKKRQNNAEVEELLKDSPLELHEENYHPRIALEDEQVRDKINRREMAMNAEIEMEDILLVQNKSKDLNQKLNKYKALILTLKLNQNVSALCTVLLCTFKEVAWFYMNFLSVYPSLFE